MRLLVLALAAALALAGCLQQPTLDAATVDPPAAPDLMGRVVAHNATVLLPLPAAVPKLEVRIATTGERGAEPTLGVLSDGTIFTTSGGARITRSADHGRSWDVLESGTPVTRPKVSLDPWLWVDPLTDRVYNAPLYVVCTWATWSDDAGASWDANPLAGCGVPAHDHQKLTTGPAPEGVETDGYPNVVYYSYNSFRREGTVITASYDGGRTWGLGTVAHPPSGCHRGLAGPVAVGPTGVAYSPKPTCEGISIAVSRDGGQSWSEPTVLTGAGMDEALASMTDAAVDAAGNAYVTWVGGDGRVYYAASVDEGETWSEPRAVSPPAIQASVFPVVTAGDAGRVAFGYLGTSANASKWESRSAQDADGKAAWHLHLTFTEDATAESPSFVTVQATPEDDPVQVGCIWQSGGSDPCRNLADFFDMVEQGGRIYLVFADGCDKCTSAGQSRGAEVKVAIVERGPSLRDGVTLAPLPAEAAEEAEDAEEGTHAAPVVRAP